jgi:hypothetical protein
MPSAMEPRFAGRGVLIVFVTVILGLDLIAGAQCNNTWTGKAGDNQWSTAENWSKGVPVSML